MIRYQVAKIANGATEPTRICVRCMDRNSAEYAASEYNNRLGQDGYHYSVIEVGA